MLTLVTEGIVLVVHLSKSPEIATALHNIIEPLSPFEIINDSIATRISYDFSSIDLNVVQDLLLQVAGEIWTVIFLFKNQEISDMLRSLVAEFAMPGPVIIG
jgi:hypothetical protein